MLAAEFAAIDAVLARSEAAIAEAKTSNRAGSSEKHPLRDRDAGADRWVWF